MVEWKTIGEISSNVFAGGTPSTKHEEYYDGDIPWIRSGEIDFNIITKAERNITKAGYNNSSAKLIRKGSVVMAMTGATVAKSAIVDFETSANQSVCAIEPDTSIADYKYVYYYLAKEYFKIKSSAQGALTSLNLAMIKQIEIPLPSLSEQERIVGILDTFTSSIENLKAQISLRRKQYEHYREKLLDLEEKPGVEMKTLGEVLQIKKGEYITKKESKEGPYPVILGGKEPAYYIDKYNHTGKAIVVSRSGASAGYVSLWNEPIFITDGFLIEPKDDVVYDFLYYILKSMQRKLHGAQKGGAIPHITPAMIESIIIYIPDMHEQSRIVSILDEFEASIKNLEAQLKAREKQYEYYRNKLLTFE